jgi:hypothetical protein
MLQHCLVVFCSFFCAIKRSLKAKTSALHVDNAGSSPAVSSSAQPRVGDWFFVDISGLVLVFCKPLPTDRCPLVL